MKRLTAALATLLVLLGCGRPGDVETPRTAESIPVEVLEIMRGDVTATVATTGTLRAVDDVPVSAEASGRVVDVPVQVGDRVEEGDVLIVLDDELAGLAHRQANAAWVLAKTELEDAADAHRRAGVLYENEDISQVEYEAAERRLTAAKASYDSALATVGTAERRVNDMRVKSPVGGWVAFVYTEVGHLVAAGTPVAHVVNDARLKIDLGLNEDEVSDVREGGGAEISVAAVPDRTFEGVVEYVGPRADELTNTYPARVTLRNPLRRLRSGMVADVTIRTAEYEGAVVIGRDWVIERFGEPAVYVVSDSLAAIRPLKLGKVLGDRVVVTSGLAEGDLMITLGHERLVDGSRIEIKNGPVSEAVLEERDVNEPPDAAAAVRSSGSDL